MNPQRSAQVLGLFQIVVIASWIVTWFAGVESAGGQHAGAALIEDRRLPSLAAAVELVDAPQAAVVGQAAVGHAAVDRADLATAPEPLANIATGPTAVPDQPKLIVEPAPTASPPPTAGSSVQVAAVSTPNPARDAAFDETKPMVDAAATASSPAEPDAGPPLRLATASPFDLPPNDVLKPAGPIETPDACPAEGTCIDRYLWAIYERTPKEDSIKVDEQRKVTVRKRGKTVTVTKTFTKLMDEDFAWKDPKAAERAGMQLMDYVVGGMDGGFKLRLFHMLRAAEEAGLSPGITSAFRDDYRQAIASGLKAASDRSYHGGSSRGGYGHGLAADVVSVKGETRDQRYAASEALWKWIDVHGEEFGIGRPYLDRDPPHVAPIDGQEYATHHGAKAQHTASGAKNRKPLAGRHDHNAAKLPRTAGSSKARTI